VDWAIEAIASRGRTDPASRSRARPAPVESAAELERPPPAGMSPAKAISTAGIGSAAARNSANMPTR
jgi:hypothetical protein